MSFINISDPKRRDVIVKSYLTTKKNIQNRNRNEKLGDLAQAEERQNMFEPIIQSNIQAAEEISKDLVPIRKELEQLNQEIALAQPALPQETPQRRRSLPSIPTPSIGKTAADSLSKALSKKKETDPTFGIYNEGDQLMIGSLPIQIEGNDLVVDGRTYNGTEGLWQLLTKKEPVNYNESDLTKL